jgi:hypothetical protein
LHCTCKYVLLQCFSFFFTHFLAFSFCLGIIIFSFLWSLHLLQHLTNLVLL